MPVNTIATPAASAAAITSASRIEPPGSITAVAPASIADNRPSANGKEGVGRDRRALGARLRPARGRRRVQGLPRRNPRGIDPRHLPRADAGRRAILHVDDRVRLDVLGDPPGHAQVRHLLAPSAPAWSRPSAQSRRARRYPGPAPEARPRPSGRSASSHADQASRRRSSGAGSSLRRRSPKPRRRPRAR